MIRKLVIIVIGFFMLINLTACTHLNANDNQVGPRFVWQHSLEELLPEPKLRALAKAAAKGNVNKVNRLIDSGIDPNATGILNVTPVLWPLVNSNYSGVKALLDAGAKVNVCYDTSECLIGFAAKHKDPRFLKLLLDRGANANEQYGTLDRTPLYDTLGEGESDKLKRKYLYSAGGDINAISKGYSTIIGQITSPVIDALSADYYTTALELLRRGADPYLKSPDGQYKLEKHVQHKDKRLLPATETRKNFESVREWLVDNAPKLNVKKK